MEKKRIAVIACKNIKGISCGGGCLKCFKGMAEKEGEYERWKDYEIDLVSMDDCGGCPGVIVPKVKLMTEMGKLYDRQIDAIHLGTCIKLATLTSQCPIDVEDVQMTIKDKFQKDVILGTHPY